MEPEKSKGFFPSLFGFVSNLKIAYYKQFGAQYHLWLWGIWESVEEGSPFHATLPGLSVLEFITKNLEANEGSFSKELAGLMTRNDWKPESAVDWDIVMGKKHTHK